MTIGKNKQLQGVRRGHGNGGGMESSETDGRSQVAGRASAALLRGAPT